FRFKCFAGCGEGDEITFLEKCYGISNKEATKLFLEMARVNRATSAEPKPTFDWRACVEAFKEKHVEQVAKMRGYSPEFLGEFRAANLIGIFNGLVAFPVYNGGQIVGCHYRSKQRNKSWYYFPEGINAAPFVIGELTPGERVQCFESTWDGLDYM